MTVQDAALLDGLVHLPNCLSAETQQWLGDACMQLGNGDDVAGARARPARVCFLAAEASGYLISTLQWLSFTTRC